MEKFFSKTRIFWKISRFIFIFLFGYALLIINKESDFDWKNVLLTILISIDLIFLLIIGISDILKKKYLEGIKIYTGIFSILYAVGIFYLLFQELLNSTFAMILITFLVGLWLILFGVRKILFLKKVRSVNANL
ncbi:hypothetical protein C7S20_12735 [Christiangramia fulva]|uniref:Uncharacterized protein n=1 Tax=Christiangramia fulva TaxID=2126553 RepID=A0A2R3Z703_9FLAO|nr:hypothetical protein [Christiangramia fulva]AVR46050.1 hypothetical protein C7S20_12735 [Christiangramia fulva]